jgi:hypothetical protein
VGPLVAPGKYTVQLTVAGKTATQEMEVLKSPKTPAEEAELQALVKMQLQIRDDINETSDMVNHLEWMRKQDDDIAKMLRVQGGNADLLKSVQAFDQKMQTVEYRFISREDADSDDKYYSQSYKVYLKLIWLNGEVGTGAGDVAGGANFGLTETSQAMLKDIEKDLSAARVEYRALFEKELPAVNRELISHGAMPVFAGAESRPGMNN